MTDEAVARICHEVNRAYCASIGDRSQVPWDAAPADIKASAVSGVRYQREHPETTPAATHEEWMRFKAAAGWRWGPRKDATTKEHPCMAPYDELPPAQRTKDSLFLAVCRAAPEASA